MLDGGNGFERARDHLSGARFVGFVGQTAFEQLGVGEDDSELIVEAVIEPRNFWAVRLGLPRRPAGLRL